MYWWSNQNKKAVAIGKQALDNHINDAELGYKLAQAYQRTNNLVKSNKIIDSIIKKYPKNNDYLNFKKSLK